MLFGEEEHLVIEEVPVAGILAVGDDGNQESRCCGKIRSLQEKDMVSISYSEMGRG